MGFRHRPFDFAQGYGGQAANSTLRHQPRACAGDGLKGVETAEQVVHLVEAQTAHELVRQSASLCRSTIIPNAAVGEIAEKFCTSGRFMVSR